jgi:hypothetical protein
MRTAITLHISPNVPQARGPVAYLLAAGAGADVVGLRCWQLPPDLLATLVEQHPRLGFKGEFTAACRTEATLVPRGECSSCAATAPSTSPSGSHPSAADPPLRRDLAGRQAEDCPRSHRSRDPGDPPG